MAANSRRISGGTELVPDPWSYNPSKWSQRLRIAALAFMAAALSVYMALFQWGIIDSVWDPIFGKGSQRVLDSDLSHRMQRWILMPDAALGALAYLSEVIFVLAGSTRRWHCRPWLVMLFGIDVIPLGIVSAILVICQGAVVGAWCTPCLLTAAISLLLVVLAFDEVWSSWLYIYRVWKQCRNPRTTWKAFWGKPTAPGLLAVSQMATRHDEKMKTHHTGRRHVRAHQ